MRNKNKQIAINKLSWQALAESWNKLDFPWRPAPCTIATAKKLCIQTLAQCKKPQALVMGSTVEFRDLCAETNIPATCLEISPNIYKALGSLCKHKRRKERLVEGNWLETPFANHTFDIVLGDYLTSNVRFNEWNTLFKNITTYLKPEGSAVLAIATVPPLDKRNASALPAMVGAYLKNPKQFTHFADKWWWIVKTAHVTPGVYDKRNYTFAWHTFDELLQKEVRAQRLDNTAFKAMRADVGINFDPFVPLSVVDKKLRKFFAIIQKKTDRSYHPIMRYFYTYVVEAKSKHS